MTDCFERVASLLVHISSPRNNCAPVDNSLVLIKVQLRDSARFRLFAFEINANLPWRSRLRRAGAYVALMWIIMLVGGLVFKYGFELVDGSFFTLFAESAVLPVLFFLCLVFAYREADRTKNLYEEMDRKGDVEEAGK